MKVVEGFGGSSWPARKTESGASSQVEVVGNVVPGATGVGFFTSLNTGIYPFSVVLPGELSQRALLALLLVALARLDCSSVSTIPFIVKLSKSAEASGVLSRLHWIIHAARFRSSQACRAPWTLSSLSDTWLPLPKRPHTGPGSSRDHASVISIWRPLISAIDMPAPHQGASLLALRVRDFLQSAQCKPTSQTSPGLPFPPPAQIAIREQSRRCSFFVKQQG